MATYNLDGFIGIKQVQDYSPTTPIFTADSLATAAVSTAPEGETGDIAGCNISFDLFGNIDLNIPGTDFFALYPSPNLKLFDKADQLSWEVSLINDMLISAIEEMGCCDIARKYNTTMVPFFRFFADHPDINNCGATAEPGDSCSYGTSNNFISILIDVAKVITQIQSVVEPLLCIIRPLPGNPWLPFDFDYLEWVYAYSRKSPAYLDKILSGEIMDIILNPVSNFRRKLQMCLRGGNAGEYTFFEVKAIADFNQINRILNVVAENGGEVSASKIIKPQPPVAPTPEAYPSAALYQEAVDTYEIAKESYDQKIIQYNQLKAELDNQANASKTISDYEATAINTKNLLANQGHGDLCNCVTTALGLQNLMPDWVTIHSSLDINNLVGKELGVTYGEVNISDRIHEPEDKLIFIDRYISDEGKLERIFEKAVPEVRYTKYSIDSVEESVDNPFSDLFAVSDGTFQNITIVRLPSTGTGWDIYKTNENILKDVKNIRIELEQIKIKAATISKNDREVFNDKKYQAQKALGIMADRLNQGYYADNHDVYQISYEKAKYLYDNYFASWDEYDANRDITDWKTRSAYIDPDDLVDNSIFQPISLPYDPTYDDGEPATEIEVDQRTGNIFFNNGLTATGGSLNWRTNNPLLLPFDIWTEEKGAIGFYRTETEYIAVFATVEQGVAITQDWLREQYQNKTLLEFAEEYFAETPYYIDKFLLYTEREINQKSDIILGDLSSSSLESIVRNAAQYPEFTPGQIWYNSQKLPTEPFITPKVDLKISLDQDAIYDNLPSFIQDQINQHVRYRANQYTENYGAWIQASAYQQAIDELMSIYNNNTALRIFYFKPVSIPCTCDGFVCSLLQMVVSYILALLNELLAYLGNLIIDFLIPDFIRNLIRLILEKVKCFVALFNIDETLKIIDETAKQLLEDLKWRIQLYPDDTCFIPDDLFSDPPSVDVPEDPGNPFTDPQISPWPQPPSTSPTDDDPWGELEDTEPRPTLDNPTDNIISDPDSGTIITTGRVPPPDSGLPTGGSRFPENYLPITLAITNGVKITDLKLPYENIPDLIFDCRLDEAITEFTACNQTRIVDIVLS